MEHKLYIDIHSFSYRKPLPADNTDNGGGFVFDCRGILNPGRLEEYKPLTGKDDGVIQFLEQNTRMTEFLTHIHNAISITIENYVEREFDHLQIAFGCTGGQHRSVYCAEKTAEFIRNRFPETVVTITHNEQPQLNP